MAGITVYTSKLNRTNKNSDKLNSIQLSLGLHSGSHAPRVELAEDFRIIGFDYREKEKITSSFLLTFISSFIWRLANIQHARSATKLATFSYGYLKA